MFADTFVQLLSDYPDGLKDKRRFAALLHDHFPEDIMHTNLVYTAYGLGLPVDIEQAAGITNAFAFRYVKRLMEEHGVSRANADWAVAVWCVCYGKQMLGKPCDANIQIDDAGSMPTIRGDTGSGGQYGSLFTYVKLEDGYGVRSFAGTNQQTIIFPDRYNGLPVREIMSASFSGCEVNEAVMTNSVKRIGARAFSQCHQLKQVIFSQELEEIGEYAFEGCECLTTISFPSTLRRIGKYAFMGTGIKNPILAESLWSLEDGAFQDCTRIEKIVLPGKVRTVAQKLFMGCDRLTEAILPDTVERIGESAFCGCGRLERLTVPNGVKDIGANAFSGTAPKFMLLVGRGSAAEQYARKNGIRFQIIY